jgi:hypothetical protein
MSAKFLLNDGTKLFPGFECVLMLVCLVPFGSIILQMKSSNSDPHAFRQLVEIKIAKIIVQPHLGISAIKNGEIHL